jgi:hypothetical protein
MRFLVVVGLALGPSGCAFEPRGVGSDGMAPSDGAASRDAPVSDAAPRPCRLAADADAVETAPVGGTGGVDRMAVRCPDGMVVVELSTLASDGVTTNGAPSTYGFELWCAHVDIVTGVLLATAAVARTGGGGFGWTPAHMAGPARCPGGQVMRRLAGATGAASNVLANLAIGCGAVAVTDTGTPRVDPTVGMAIPVVGSGSTTAGPAEATCPPNTVVVGADYRSGAGIDALTLRCAVPTCRP